MAENPQKENKMFLAVFLTFVQIVSGTSYLCSRIGDHGALRDADTNSIPHKGKRTNRTYMLTDNQLIRLIFGFKVRHLRQQHELSYQQLSKLTGLSTSYLNDIEKGKRYPKPDKINALAEALNVDYNYMVSLNASKRLQPIIDLLSSHFFKLFPLHEFGISLEKLIELFSQTPDRINAFISTIFKIARNYQVNEETFYLEALRSFQDMHDNHFPKLEMATQEFKQEYSIQGILPYTTAFLEDQLEELYGISINRGALAQNKTTQAIRSYLSPESKTLYLQDDLSSAQENFLIARELGFQFLDLQERPYETTIVKIETFEKLLNNYKASHFAAALLMDERSLVEDLKVIARMSSWDPLALVDMIDKYNVTPEMLLQRLTNILPQHFGIENLFFIRLTQDAETGSYSMTKDLHLSQLHSPYNNELDEHYCHRWVSITTILELAESDEDVIVDAQISSYWDTDKDYLCISMAKRSHKNPALGVSVTLGMLINTDLKSSFNFVRDPKLKVRTVSTTCERCGVVDCESRQASPSILDQEAKEDSILQALSELP